MISDHENTEEIAIAIDDIPLPGNILQDVKSSDENDVNDLKRPDRSRTDFYCDVCDSHMSNEDTWKCHISGKRHLKNSTKQPGENPSRIKAVIRPDIPAQIQCRLDEITEPIVGLDYITEVQKANDKADPSYICYLCSGTMSVSNIIDHLLSVKHRLNCLKEEKPETFNFIESIELTKRAKELLIAENSVQLESEMGRGHVEVKVEKTKLEDMPALKQIRSDQQSGFFSSNVWSSEPLPSFEIVSDLSFQTRMQMIEELSMPEIKSDNECREIMDCINVLAQCLMEYKIRNLSANVRMNLAQQIISGNTDVLESSLGFSGSQQIAQGPLYGNSEMHRSSQTASYGINNEGAISYPVRGYFPPYMSEAAIYPRATRNVQGNSYKSTYYNTTRF